MPKLTQKRDVVEGLLKALDKNTLTPAKRTRAEEMLNTAVTRFINEAKKGNEPKWYSKNADHVGSWMQSPHLKGPERNDLKIYRSAQESLIRAEARQAQAKAMKKVKEAAEVQVNVGKKTASRY